MAKRVISATVMIGAGMLWSAPASAQALDDDFWIVGSAYWPKIDTDVRVSSKTNNTNGTDIDLEKDLDLDNDAVLPAVNAGARFGRIIVGADFYRLKRTATAAIDRDIIFDDVTYPVAASVTSGFTTDIYRLTVGYAFVQNDKAEVGAAIGLHATNFDLSLVGQASAGGEGVQTEVRRRDFLAPLPTVGLFASFEVAPKVTVNSRIDYLSLKIDDYKGRLINAQAAVTYRAFKNVGIGVMYRYVDYRVGIDKEMWTGRVRYKYYGPALFLEVGF